MQYMVCVRIKLYVSSHQCQHPESKEGVHWCYATDSIFQNNFEEAFTLMKLVLKAGLFFNQLCQQTWHHQK